VAACLHLAGAHASFSRPDPAVIHHAASRIVASETLAADGRGAADLATRELSLGSGWLSYERGP
jgi:hypothetical protein